MVTLDTWRLEKKSEIIRLAKLRGCRNVRVFGSVARGESDSQSDVEFLVDLDPGRTISDLGGLLMDLQDALGAPVDVVTERGLLVRVRERILAEAVVL
jgi:predicted nucleotidyltransferase